VQSPDVGQQSAECYLKSKDVVEIPRWFYTAGMGGGTGGAAPVIAQLARERNSYCRYCNTSILI
jgi:cell division GTPase FtsZ